MRIATRASLPAGCLIALIMVVAYFPFTADDAYIVARYADNLAGGNSWVFNLGERISAMTSPLHGLLMALLSWLTGQPIIVYKVLAIGLTAAALGLLVWRLQDEPIALALFVPLAVTAAPIWVWAVGGLETSLLLLLVTLIGLCAIDLDTKPTRNFVLLCALAGLAVITRYDAVLFAAPVVLAAGWQVRQPRLIAVGYVLGAAIVLAWLGFAWWYFGDILPTSFYVKTPSSEPLRLFANGIYILEYLVIVPVIPALLLLWLLRRQGTTNDQTRPQVAHYGIYIGLALMLFYGTTMATEHMMFSIRFFVPYLPLLAYLIAMALRPYTLRIKRSSSTRALYLGNLALMWGLALFNGVLVQTSSLNGFITFLGEYTEVSIPLYVNEFIPNLEEQAAIIAQHWVDLDDTPDRQPRVMTYAAGVLPYRLPESYVMENLISYRHADCEILSATADYLVFFTPGIGPREDWFDVETFVTLQERDLRFDGQVETFGLYYNPDPLPNIIPPTIDGACGALQR